MAFLKRNMFVLICLSVGLVSIGLGMVACSSYDSIQQSMTDAEDLGSQLGGAGKAGGRRAPIAPIDLKIQEENIETVQREIQETRRRALVVNSTGLDYIVPEAFPDPKGDPALQVRFIRAYEVALAALPGLLDAKPPPNQDDIANVQERIDEEREELGLEPKRTGSDRSTAPRTERRSRDRADKGGGMNLRGLGAFRDRKRGTRSDLSRRPAPDKRSAPAEAEQEPVDEAEQIRFDATRRAELERAQSIRCYVSPGIGGTFTVVGAAMNPQVAVDPALLWQAQMTLWVQREVCMALAEVNENAAKALTEAGQENVDVTTLPIKRLIRLAVGTYRVIDRMADAPKGKGKKGSKKKASKSRSAPKRSKGLGGGGLGAALAARGVGRQAPDKDKDKAAEKGSASFQADLVGETWTGRQSGEDLDVVPVAIQLVMDQRYLPQVIDRVCHANFYVPTRVSYRALRASEIPREYVYGANPVVGVTLTFERYFFPEVYADKMPVIVHDILGHVLADESADEGRRGGRSTGRRPRRR